MTDLRVLARASILLRAQVEREHARRALAHLATCPSSARRQRPGHGSERMSAVHWRRAKRHLRQAERLEAQAQEVDHGR